jgi:hypothetical protein
VTNAWELLGIELPGDLGDPAHLGAEIPGGFCLAGSAAEEFSDSHVLSVAVIRHAGDDGC